jgi:ABC-type glycerol-3-phosphate transport system permease component/peptidoglycan/LPS O-acetylase OafA/YrhL
LSGGAFVAPFFVMFGLFGLFGLLFNLFVTFHRWQPLGDNDGFHFRGLRGYAVVLTNPDFWPAMFYSLSSALPKLIVLHGLAFSLAYAMFLLYRRTLSVFGMLMFLPYIAMPIGLFASLAMFFAIFARPLSDLIKVLHTFWPSLPPEPSFASAYQVFFGLWNNLGWNVLLYLMAFAVIPRSTLEAVALDGAGFWTQLRKIALPLARPMVFVAVSMSLVTGLQANTWRPGAGSGGPPVGLPAFIYREAFTYQNLDNASVMTWVFFFVMLALVLVVYALFGRNFLQIEQPAALETNTMPMRLSKLTTLVIKLLVMFMVVLCTLPFLMLLTQSTQIGSGSYPPQFSIGSAFSYNYAQLTDALPSFWRNFMNSLYVSSLAALGAMMLSTPAGFAFAALEFRGKRVLFGVVMCAMVFPAMSNAIPYLIQMRVLDWLDTPRALWVPSTVSALGVFLVRQYALNALPKTMLEAARVDGASNWRLFWRIALPNLMPVTLSVGLLVFVTTWNKLDAAFYVMRSLETRLLPDALGFLLSPMARTSFTAGGLDTTMLDLVVTGAAIGTIPLLLIYALASSQLGRGLGLGQVGFSLSLWSRSLRSWWSIKPDARAETRTRTLGGADGVRGLAVILLVMGHVWQRLNVTDDMPGMLRNLQGFFGSGGFRVSAFFVLSGMLLSYPFWQRYLSGEPMPGLRRFARRRFLRIAPSYWTCLIVSFVLSGMLFFLPDDQQPFRWWRFLSGLTFTSGLHYVTFFPVELNGPLWSIGYEALFYVLMPLGMLGLFALTNAFTGPSRLKPDDAPDPRARPRSVIVAVMYWLVLLGVVMVIQEWMIQNAVPESDGRGWQYGLVGGAKQWFPNYNPIGFFGHYIIGVLSAGFIAWWQRRRREISAQHRVFDVLATLSGVVALGVMYTHVGQAEFAWSIGQQPAAFPFYTLLIGVLLATLPFSVGAQRVLDNRFLRYTAKISFSLFLWHHLVLEMIYVFHNYQYSRFGGLPDLALWAWISVMAVLVMYGIASWSYNNIEKPFLERPVQSGIRAGQTSH